MSATDITQMADRIAALLQQRLKIPGRTLTEKLARGRRKLPRRVHKAASDLAIWAEMAQNPKLYAQLDRLAVANAYDICARHLGEVGKWDRRRALAEGWLLSALTSLIVAAAGIILILRWRGYL